MRVKVGLIGISGYGKVHLDNLSQLWDKNELEITAAVVINPDQVAEDLAMLRGRGTRIYPSLEEMLTAHQHELQLICIPTGIPFHESMTVAALNAGANVLVEKPAAGSPLAVMRMESAENRSRNKVSVGFQHIYAREIQFIKQYLVSGRLGAVRRISVYGLWPRGDAYYGRNNWAGRMFAADGSPICDSPINNAFAHHLNLQLFLAGRSFARMARATGVEGSLYRARPEIETFDTCALRFSTAENIELVTLLSHACEDKINPHIRVDCENGCVEWEQRGGWKISADGKVLYSGIAEAPHQDMFRDMLRLVNGEEVFRCTLSMAEEHTRCIAMLHRDLQVAAPAQSIRRAEDGQYIIPGVRAAFEKAFADGVLPQL